MIETLHVKWGKIKPVFAGKESAGNCSVWVEKSMQDRIGTEFNDDYQRGRDIFNLPKGFEPNTRGWSRKQWWSCGNTRWAADPLSLTGPLRPGLPAPGVCEASLALSSSRWWGQEVQSRQLYTKIQGRDSCWPLSPWALGQMATDLVGVWLWTKNKRIFFSQKCSSINSEKCCWKKLLRSNIFTVKLII